MNTAAQGSTCVKGTYAKPEKHFIRRRDRSSRKKRIIKLKPRLNIFLLSLFRFQKLDCVECFLHIRY